MNATKLTNGMKVREIDTDGNTLGFRVVIGVNGTKATCALFKPLVNKSSIVEKVIRTSALVPTGELVAFPTAKPSKDKAEAPASTKAPKASKKGTQPEGLRRYQAERKAAKAGVSAPTSTSTDAALSTKVSLVVEALESAIAVLRTI